MFFFSSLHHILRWNRFFPFSIRMKCETLVVHTHTHEHKIHVDNDTCFRCCTRNPKRFIFGHYSYPFFAGKRIYNYHRHMLSAVCHVWECTMSAQTVRRIFKTAVVHLKTFWIISMVWHLWFGYELSSSTSSILAEQRLPCGQDDDPNGPVCGFRHTNAE